MSVTKHSPGSDTPRKPRVPRVTLEDRAPSEIPRTVNPRNWTDRAAGLNIITIIGGVVRSEHDPEPRTVGDLPPLLKSAPESLVVTHQHTRVFHQLNEAFATDPAWDWQVSVRLDTLAGVDPRFKVEQVAINVVGWKRGNKKRGKWHHFLDPTTFCPAVGWPANLSLYDFAADVRAFLVRYGLTPSARAGGIAGQLLRHPHIYDSPRRKVPGFINEHARQALPGNHYQFVDGRPGIDYASAWYLDQESAHHDAAASLALPHADHLVAVGPATTDDSKPPPDRPLIAGDGLGAFLDRAPMGLLYARARVSRDARPAWLHGSAPAPRWYRHLLSSPGGSGLVHLFTNELAMLSEYGVELEYIVAAWVSRHPDENMNLYATWAMAESRRAKGLTRLWLKPTLLAAYGMLAARTTDIEFVRRQGRADARTVTVGRETVKGVSGGPRKFLPKMANVVQRGMIEAETRKRSCMLALDQRRKGYNVLSIYADGVLIEAECGGPPPRITHRLAGDNWRAKHQLAHLRFTDETHFLSAEMVRWPGQQPPQRRQHEPDSGSASAGPSQGVSEVPG